jgi:hypothetical protein
MIGPDWIGHLHAYIAGAVRGQGATCLAVGGVADHVHILAGLKSTHALADFVREVKRNSSIWAAERYHAFEWQIGYGAFSVSSRDVVGYPRTYGIKRSTIERGHQPTGCGRFWTNLGSPMTNVISSEFAA